MSNDTRHGWIATEVVSGGTQRDVEERPTPEAMIIGIALWVGLLGFFAWKFPWILVFVVGVAVSIMLHEFGHFWTARRSGMKATQFFLGFGPRVWSTHRNGVEYGLRAIPLGGFVKIIGMTNLDEVAPEDEAFTYREASFPRRMWVITAGSVMHVIIAVVVIVGVYAFAGSYQEAGRVTVFTVSAGSPAASAGLRPHDVVTAVNDKPVTSAADFRTLLGATAPGTTVTLSVIRDGAPMSIDATLAQSPSAPAGAVKGYLGVTSDSQERVKQGLGDALVQGPRDLVTGVGQASAGILRVLNPVNLVGHLTGSNTDTSSRPGTLVGAAQVSNAAGKTDGWAGSLSVLAALNVSVGVFNMFPLMPLDGGHAGIAIYERIRSRRGRRYHADAAKLMPVAAACLTLLAFMFLTGLYLDIGKG